MGHFHIVFLNSTVTRQWTWSGWQAVHCLFQILTIQCLSLHRASYCTGYSTVTNTIDAIQYITTQRGYKILAHWLYLYVSPTFKLFCKKLSQFHFTKKSFAIYLRKENTSQFHFCSVKNAAIFRNPGCVCMYTLQTALFPYLICTNGSQAVYVCMYTLQTALSPYLICTTVLRLCMYVCIPCKLPYPLIWSVLTVLRVCMYVYATNCLIPSSDL